MKYYLAAPVVTDNPETKNQVDKVHQILKALFGKDVVYRPGEHKVPNAWGITMEMWGQCVFTMDVLAIDEADWIVLCNYGRKGDTILIQNTESSSLPMLDVGRIFIQKNITLT